MISKDEVPKLIDAELHTITTGMKYDRIAPDVYKSIASLTDCTRHAVLDHNFNLSKKYFLFAERLYEQGDLMIRSAIENIFIYSFSSLFAPGNKIEKLILKSIIPVSLFAVYMNQLMQSGC